MKRYIFSEHIKKKTLTPEVNEKLESYLKLFNQMRITAFARQVSGKGFPYDGSAHKAMKAIYGVNDYFVTAVEGAVKMTVRSQKELLSLYLEDLEKDISDITDKIDVLKERRDNLLKMKESLIQYTKSPEKDRSLVKNFKSSGISFKDGGKVTVGFSHSIKGYPNVWAFEHGYLEPKIKQLKGSIGRLKDVLHRKQVKKERLEKQIKYGAYSVYFGSRKLMHADIPETQKKKAIYAKRAGRMTLAGRNDAGNGNFMVHYDAATHRLSYLGSGGEFLEVGKVEFSYCQQELDSIIGAGGSTGAPIAWTIVDCGNAWRFDACLTLPDGGRENSFYGDGCIGVDINSDRLAVVETDASGCPRDRGVIPLKLDGTSEANKKEISDVLEKVFAICREAHKPLAAEDIGNVKRKAGRYNKESRKNRAISMFASQTMLQLLESKAYKYDVAATFVNPAYTSQSGKMKYMRHYGLSIHESAALCIARRAMGLTEKLPGELSQTLSQKAKQLPHIKQWAKVYKITSAIKPSTVTEKITPDIMPEFA